MPRLVLTIVLVASVLAACGSSNHSAAPDAPTTPETAPTTPTTDSADEAVLAAEDAYRNFSRVWTAANDPPDPAYPALAEVATGGALELVRTAIRRHSAERVLFRDPPD